MPNVPSGDTGISKPENEIQHLRFFSFSALPGPHRLFPFCPSFCSTPVSLEGFLPASRFLWLWRLPNAALVALYLVSVNPPGWSQPSHLNYILPTPAVFPVLLKMVPLRPSVCRLPFSSFHRCMRHRRAVPTAGGCVGCAAALLVAGNPSGCHLGSGAEGASWAWARACCQEWEGTK